MSITRADIHEPSNARRHKLFETKRTIAKLSRDRDSSQTVPHQDMATYQACSLTRQLAANQASAAQRQGITQEGSANQTDPG